MSKIRFYLMVVAAASSVFTGACGAPAGNGNLAASNGNAARDTIANANANVAGPGSAVDAREPSEYQATVKLSLQTMGSGQQQVNTPPIGARVARSGNDRVMEFNLPTNEKVIFLDKGGTNYMILPNRRQYAELTKEALGFEVRRMMMPDQMVNQAKSVPGMKLVGEEMVNGRQATKFSYAAVANTNTAAGTVATDSYMLIDKETGLPLRTETISQSQSGANVQGVSGVRVITEMTDITTTPDKTMFDLPTDYQKIDPETVKANVSLIFNAVAALIGQAMTQARPAGNANSTATPTVSPAG
jgi:hypothetical protein